ncbi:unnamed protein product [Lactuca virosa]|uniref:Remorin C-terminal domain-containing protein n=1 Tax=Lactuca virosa TaxID=75947 RepID=A0AAU9NN98_9ASTR|nr:unnamed protein product [Lactuca virosa]
MQVCYSPQLGSTTKNPSSFRHSGAYTSPGTPDYGDNNVGSFQKGWYSERVALPSNSSRRHISAAALMPFNSGRTLPSKWDDAERWITSPLSGFGVCKTTTTTTSTTTAPPPRRPKAKSGPLGLGGTTTTSTTPGGVHNYFSNYSPALLPENGSSKNFLTTGVLVPDHGLPFHHGVVQSPNIPGWSELLIGSPYPDSQDENGVSRVVSRRDMATQMSPVSSPETYTPPPVEGGSHHSSRSEVRDVQVDKGVTMTKRSKRHKMKVKKKNNRLKESNNELSLTWNTTEGAMKLSKLQKEEARITAWENLQNAKAEASIRKLEMKLEKKKSASMDKILNKHRDAQMKAQEMRSRMSESVAPRDSWKFRRFFKNSIGGCFHCHHDHD